MIGSPVMVSKYERSWGRFEQYTHNLPCAVKIIIVSAGGTLSRQYHHHRDELWVILDEGARVEILEPERGEKIFIPRGTVHRLWTAGEREVRILEISFGEFDEEDIYGRAGSRSVKQTFAEIQAVVDGQLRNVIGV